MQQSSQKRNHLSRIGAGLAFVLCLGTFLSPAFARERVTNLTARKNFPPPLLIAMADPPNFLAPAPTCKKQPGEKGKEGAITPFIGTRQALTLLPTPERPAIVSDVEPQKRPEVTAGVDVNLGTVEFNLGYTLPSNKIDNIVSPFGVELEPGKEGNCFSLGVKVPF